MSKTMELRKVITGLLKQVNDNTFYEIADDEAPFPYLVYDLNSIDFGNVGRDDVILTVNVWDRNKKSNTVEDISDMVENLLNGLNNPTDKVLPTFYIISRNSIPDDDKSIRRRELRFQVQNYYIGE